MDGWEQIVYGADFSVDNDFSAARWICLKDKTQIPALLVFSLHHFITENRIKIRSAVVKQFRHLTWDTVTLSCIY